MNPISALCVSISILFNQTGSTSDELAANYARSDVVLIGEVSSEMNPPWDHPFRDDYRTVNVSVYMKGNGPEILTLRPAELVHARMDCCDPGTYMFFLRRLKDGSYVGVAGRNSVITITTRPTL